MKIAYLSYSPLGAGVANAVHVMNMCSAFSGNGHETSLFARGPAGDENAVEIFSRYGVSHRFNLALRRAVKVKVGGRILYAFLQAHRARTREQAEMHYARCVVSAAFALMLGAEVVLEVHEVPRTPLERWIQHFVLRHRRLLRVVVISRALLEDLESVHGDVLRDVDCLVAPDGASLRPTSEPFPLARGRGRQIGYAGGLRSGNGIGTLLALAESFPGDTFHLLGGSPDEIARWKRVQRTANIAWYGRCDPARVPAFLEACDVLLAPYEHGPKTHTGRDTSRWMSPLKIFEYMAAGKPMIASDFPVLREVLQEDIAELAPPSNLDAWTRALEKLADQHRRERLGAAARRALESRYTWEARAESVLQGLDEARLRRSRKIRAARVPVPSARRSA